MISSWSCARDPVARLVGLADLAGRRLRVVDLGRVRVAAAQLRGRGPAAGHAGRAHRTRRVLDLHDRARPRHVERPHPPYRDLDPILPAGLVAPVLAQLVLEVGALAVGRLLVPAGPVEGREVGGLPVMRVVGGDAHDLVAVARPVDRAVVLVPAEADRIVRPEPLSERLVVEPGLAAVGDRGQRQRAGERDAEQRGDAKTRPQRQTLEPQEADRQRRRSPRRATAAASRRATRRARRRARATRSAKGTGSRGRFRAASTRAAPRSSAAASRPPRAPRAATGRRRRRASARCPATGRRPPARPPARPSCAA